MPQMIKGSQPTDGGFLIVSDSERDKIIQIEPNLTKWLRAYVGGEELINNKRRWCFWLKDADPAVVKNSPILMERLAKVQESRERSPTKSVREFAKCPALFTQDRQPTSMYLAIPEVSSINRRYSAAAW